ncbi:MAG: formate dehydrogenase accessory protein FdhE [Desulfobacter sp.]|nr:MAG: formate dehydrogenase accessory protein FdhE [Desulfobacter sp.]
MENNTLRIISKTMGRMAAREHLPRELMSLLGRTAQLQADESNGLDLDLSGINLSRSPICPPEQFPLDRNRFTALARKIINLILNCADEMPPAMAQAALAFNSALKNGELHLETALREVQACIAGKSTPGPTLAAWAKQIPGAPSAMAFLVTAAAAPSIESGAVALAEAAGLDREAINPTGTCPVCGSLPYMLELREKEGQRFAHCAHCRHTYRIRRLSCACCNTDNADQLKYFTADGEPGYRVETCDACRTYIKTIDFRELDREAFAPLNDLESMSLDILAGNEGFQRMAPSVWSI